MAQANSSKQKNKTLAAISLSILITASATFLLTSHFSSNRQTTEEFIETIISDEPAETGERLRYFNDNITLSGKNSEGEDFLLILDLYRKELEKGKFLHYYIANYWNGEIEVHDYISFNSDGSNVQANDFLLNYANQGHEDLSTRESLEFEVRFEEEVIKAKFQDLEGDFITKNNLNYTRYLSASQADVVINQSPSFQVDGALEKAYADDHSKFVYFPGFDDLTSRTYRFLVWDEKGAFYLLDDSKVSKQTPYYADHTWILSKNSEGESTKAFTANIAFREEETKFWQIEIPQFKTILNLKTNYPTDENWVEGPIFGTIEKNGKTMDLHGTFSYKKE